MKKNRTYHKKKTVIVFAACVLMLAGLMGRMVYLMVIKSDYYAKKAEQLHERERDIKAARGRIIDAKGEILADNKAVCTISVIHSQVKEPDKIIAMLQKELGLSEETARKRVEKVSSIEKVKTNVEKEVGDRIREYGLAGVKVDEDFKRYYPCNELASKVLGFTGGDNQGIIGLEVWYDDILKGIDGKILTTTDARGVEIDELGESRVEPVAGYDLPICPGSENTLFLLEYGTQPLQSVQMQVNGAFPYDTASRMRHGRVFESAQQTSQQNDRGAHFLALTAVNLCFLHMGRVQRQGISLMPDLHAQFPQDFFHNKDICDLRAVMQYTFPFMQKSGSHHWQRRIFRTLYPYFACERISAFYPNFIQVLPFLPPPGYTLLYAERRKRFRANASGSQTAPDPSLPSETVQRFRRS